VVSLSQTPIRSVSADRVYRKLSYSELLIKLIKYNQLYKKKNIKMCLAVDYDKLTSWH